ncbi:alkylmercury lyase family protein [Streptomyces liliifuscus]|uniref:Alkylmercury lyase family protein n=1 Tax=Streptomyces liliifuscus TaxID=2797636 RepID=A0A7T7L6L9_9ACTN|nr:alkylmercury lyase family protein [Streptomyces liliifuscus]QQM47408.1 alkylmercury lyase family protein [Streptomyces liliifuscus]
MRITILTVPECPNVPVVRERITQALDGRAAVIDLVEVSEEGEAARWGMTGSPTVLLDGIDPFRILDAPPSVSCRLYRDTDGRTDGAPSVQALREASMPQAAEGQDCCEATDLLDPTGRAGRGRRAPAERGLRLVQQAVLRHFATTGRVPEAALLEAVAAQAGRSAGEVLAELDHEDFLTLDASGRIKAAYPFSAAETRHQVRLANGVSVSSMCAIDALGISAMLGQDLTVSSTDPVDAQPVTVSFTGGAATWEPAEAVVFVGRREGEGPAAAVCCDALNFFASQGSAEQWQSTHPEVRGEIVSQARATRIGQQTFGPLLQNG